MKMHILEYEDNVHCTKYLAVILVNRPSSYCCLPRRTSLILWLIVFTISSRLKFVKDHNSTIITNRIEYMIFQPFPISLLTVLISKVMNWSNVNCWFSRWGQGSTCLAHKIILQCWWMKMTWTSWQRFLLCHKAIKGAHVVQWGLMEPLHLDLS